MKNEELVGKYMKAQIPILQEFIAFMSSDEEISEETENIMKIYQEYLQTLNVKIKMFLEQ